MIEKDDILLKRIANHLIINANFMDDIGLYHGKMGVVLFFAHYARYIGESLYDEFAGELLDEICENIPETLPINMEFGLCGIGWGIEYLIRNRFMEGDSDEILMDIDQKIMERDLRRVKDYSLATGLMGISCYIQSRLQATTRNVDNMPFDNTYLSEWKKVIAQSEIWDEQQVLLSLLKKQPKENEISSLELGLIHGYAGVGIKKLF